MTTRNESVALDPCHRRLEVPVFNSSEGSDFLINIAGRSGCSNAERKATVDFSETLGGFPLPYRRADQTQTLDHSTTACRLQEKSTTPSSNPEIYAHSLETVFQGSLDLLGDRTSKILGVLSVVSPDGVPEALFQINKLPETLSFCEDSDEYVTLLSSSTSLTNFLFVVSMTQC